MPALITGGARSGKSLFAEAYTERLGAEGIYIATAQIYDDEMRERVGLHRERRENGAFRWRTVEEPYNLADRLLQLDAEFGGIGSAPVILVDCLTLWLSNWLLRSEDGAHEEADSFVLEKVGGLLEAVRQCRFPLLLVTNEVGNGLVPEYPLGRRFRDLSGMMNQRLAAVCDQVFLVTAGIPVELKSIAFRLPDK